MIVKVQENMCFQKCVCEEITSHAYSSLEIKWKYIKMPQCIKCGSLEILCNNNADDAHSIKVTKIFAKVATQG